MLQMENYFSCTVVKTKSQMSLQWVLSFICLTFYACNSEEVIPEIDPDYVLQGGEATIFSSGPDAFTFPMPHLDAKDFNTHFSADAAFEQQFISAPAPQFGGLGPLFNQNSCDRCHTRNGRSSIPQFDGDPNSGLLLRLSMQGVDGFGNPIPVPGFGGQLQNKSMVGAKAEGIISFSYKQQIQKFLDGKIVILKQPVYSITHSYIPFPAGALISPRNAPPVHGLGLLEAIPESSVLAKEDVNDLDRDGISGKANRVWDILKREKVLGRFGWKAEQPTGKQQAAAAAHNDMGLTNHYFPEEHCAGQTNCTAGLQKDLDVDDTTIDLFAFYFQTLGVPARRSVNDVDVRRGRFLFSQAKCNSCHVEKYVTGSFPIKSLENQTIHPYTDLLLHDMGENLADNRPVGDATGREWRTPPLWGIGLTQVVNSHAGFMHDGRAATLEEAILWHGGEAQRSSEFYKSLALKDRNALLAFLKSL